MGRSLTLTGESNGCGRLNRQIGAYHLTQQRAANRKAIVIAVYNNVAMQNDNIEILGEITEVEIIAVGYSIRDLDRLQKKAKVAGEN